MDGLNNLAEQTASSFANRFAGMVPAQQMAMLRNAFRDCYMAGAQAAAYKKSAITDSMVEKTGFNNPLYEG